MGQNIQYLILNSLLLLLLWQNTLIEITDINSHFSVISLQIFLSIVFRHSCFFTSCWIWTSSNPAIMYFTVSHAFSFHPDPTSIPVLRVSFFISVIHTVMPDWIELLTSNHPVSLPYRFWTLQSPHFAF